MQAADPPRRPDSVVQIFLEARTHKAWCKSAVSEAQLRQLYELVRWGPTSNNSAPARFEFVTGGAARETLNATIDEGNRKKVANAPVITIVAFDVKHWRYWQRLSPHKNLELIFGQDPAASATEAYRNALLQAGYLVIAARAIGLDVFPLTGFDRATLDRSGLLPDDWRSILLCCLGTGDEARLRARAERLSFEEACLLL